MVTRKQELEGPKTAESIDQEFRGYDGQHLKTTTRPGDSTSELGQGPKG